jgi:RND family efflux transporter MFP subunit
MAAVQDALDEALTHESETAWPQPTGSDQPHGALAHQKLVGLLGAESVASIPLRDGDNHIVGAVLFVDEPPASAFPLIKRHGMALATCLAALECRQLGFVARGIQQLLDKVASRRGRLICLAVACLALLMIVPWPYQIHCDCRLQPVVRRFVVAPYDGTLATSQAAPGDIVEAGDVLAHMDGREIRWEIASLTADFARAEKERDAAMATHRTGASQLAELEMDRLEVQINQLEHRLENLAIRSPIDGVIVAGDLEKAQGAPLTIGQTLFEVAPLDRMSIELNVPEEDVASVGPAMEVVVNLDAFPDDPLKGNVDRIHPQAEVRDKESVFVAEFEMGNPDQRLRPGMNGWAKITGEGRSLGWILFHKPWTAMRRALAW